MKGASDPTDAPRGAWICGLGLACLIGLSLFRAPSIVSSSSRTSVEQHADRDLERLHLALLEYTVRAGCYPARLEELLQLDKKGRSNPKALDVPLDPWGRRYVYSVLEDGSGYSLFTLGADGEPGGSGVNKDLSLVSPPRIGIAER